MFWLAYLFTVIVGGTFAVILRVLRKVLRNWGRLRIRNQKRAPQRIAEHLSVLILLLPSNLLTNW